MRPSHRHLLSLAALLTTGCQQYPEDPVFAYGQVLHADGSPRSGAALSFERAPNDLGQLPSLLPADFSSHTTANADADGAFTLELLSGDTFERVSEGQFRSYRFRLVSPMEEGRAAILTFSMSGDVELPALRPWVADLSVDEGAAGPTVSFAPVPPRPELPPTGTWPHMIHPETGVRVDQEGTIPRPVVQLLQEGEIAWQEEVAGSPWTADPWVREDFQALEVMVRVQTTASWEFIPLGGERSGVSFQLEWRSERLPLPGAKRLPVSRGASCAPLPAGVTACPWTDGKLVPVALPVTLTKPAGSTPPRETGPEALRLTLATLARPTHAVIRGLDAERFPRVPVKKVLFEGSEDGERWVSLGELVRGHSHLQSLIWAADNPFDPPLVVDPLQALYLEGALRTETPVRHVRMRGLTEDGRAVELRVLREVSLFE